MKSPVILLSLFVLCNFALKRPIKGLKKSELVLAADSSSLTKMDVNKGYLLFVHSSPGCGHCHLLKRAIAKKELPDNLRIIFLEYVTSVKYIIEHKSSFSGHEVRYVPIPVRDYKVRIFPFLQLARASDSSVVKQYRGYRPNFWQDLFRRVAKN